MNEPRGRPTGPGAGGEPALLRWECACQPTPVLLGTYDANGHVNIKSRDRYWRVSGGRVETLCPRCGTVHVLDPTAPAAAPSAAGSAAR